MTNGKGFFSSLIRVFLILIRQKRNKIDNALISLKHEQQQEAVEEIQKLAKQGISMGQAIQIIANQLREKYQQNQLDQTEGIK